VIRAAVLAVILLLASCAPRPPLPPRLTLAPARFDDLAGWHKDHIGKALPAILKSCAALLDRTPGTAIGPDGLAGTVADWQAPCVAAARLGTGDDEAVRRFLETDFRPWRAANNDDPSGLFTGYFEPELNGARAPGGRYAVPLLHRPPDLVTVNLGQFRPAWRGDRIAGRVVGGRLEPYATRKAIEAGALDPLHLAFLWVDNPVDAFFLQVQGSGRVRLPDGSFVQVGYAGQNGQPYVAIGRLLVERGALARDDVSLATIRAWLGAHPAEARALMDDNPSYVFFRERKGDGPIGSEGVALTPGRSLAIDPTFLPLGVPLWLDVSQDDRALQRLVVAQDTGGAIRGPVRGDLFWGFGPDAERAAGRMRAFGAYYMLLPKSVVPPQQRVAAASDDGTVAVRGRL